LYFVDEFLKLPLQRTGPSGMSRKFLMENAWNIGNIGNIENIVDIGNIGNIRNIGWSYLVIWERKM
jgi:hypothetical protein